VRAWKQPSDTRFAEMRTFFDEVHVRCASRYTAQIYRRRTLEYYGLPWPGEVATIAGDGLDRIGSDTALCFALLRDCGSRL
jgi:hypothetical protein